MAGPFRNGNGQVDNEQVMNTLNILLTQTRTANNQLANLISILSTLQGDFQTFVRIQSMTRDKRFEEEIHALEAELDVLGQQLNEKKSTKADIRSTSDRIRAVTKEELEEQARSRQIDWKVVRQTIVNTIAAAMTVSVVWAIISHLGEIGAWIASILRR